MHNETQAEKKPTKGLQKLKAEWPELSLFERFEHIVLLFISFILAIIILIALMRLVGNVFQLAEAQITDNTDFKAFQITFGMLLTLLIVFEFRNSIDVILEGRGLCVQVRIVVLIAIIALARKFIVLDPKEYDAGIMAAYAAIALSLGAVYWLLSTKVSGDMDSVCK